MAFKTKEIESRVCAIQDFSSPEFIYELLLAYGKPKSSITRLRLNTAGTYNLSSDPNEVYWRDNVLFKYIDAESKDELLLAIDALSHDKEKLKHNPKFVIVTNWNRLLAVDIRDYSSLDIAINEIGKHYSFFLPWAGMNKASLKTENEADIKAAEKMANLYDEIIRHNIEAAGDEAFIHALNVFFSRLLFCFFAEDTNVFQKNLFTNTVEQHTQKDGSDLGDFLTDVFAVMNIKYEDRGDLASHLNAFPYVNGKLFARRVPLPRFSSRARQLLIECGGLVWAKINPDIFGSMIQAVVHPGERASAGMHYTSVVNIMKVIEPLFLDELYAEYEKVKDNRNKLWGLLARIYKIKVFDPACGSGNFLVIAYKELRKLEHLILQRINKLGLSNLQSQIKLENFYGIEIDDFAHEIAMVSLWLAKHQMNSEFDELFGTHLKLIPLSEAGNITAENAVRVDWNSVCPKAQGDEIYILGNPPYLGGKRMSDEQKKDMGIAFSGHKNYGELDYIACWFIKAAGFLQPGVRFAFVTTSSICQGSQVQQLWPYIFDKDLEIFFAHKPFKWANNAKNNAGVTCSIIGVKAKSNTPKYIYEIDSKKGVVKHTVDNINAYLATGSLSIVYQRLKPISDLPLLITGNSPYDGGNLVLSTYEKNELLYSYPSALPLLRRLYGSQDFINGKERWCLWIENENLDLAESILPIRERIEKTKEFRAGGGAVAKGLVKRPHQFRYTHTAKESLIIIPRVSSERRTYIPFGFLGNDAIVSDSAQVIYDPEPWVFGVISSKLHMVWVRLIAGRLKTDIRYSSALVYNNFPVPALSKTQKSAIADHVFEVIACRENHSELTLGELYDPIKMPLDLRRAHNGLDEIVERSYRGRTFESDEERLSYLFREYEKLIVKHGERK